MNQGAVIVIRGATVMNGNRLEEVHTLVELVRRQLLGERGDQLKDDDRATDAGQLLLGHCHENARELALFLDARLNLDVWVIHGGIWDSEQPAPSTVAEIERAGCEHCWVEIQPEGIAGHDESEHSYKEPVICDVACETVSLRGLPLVTTELPAEYVRVADSRVEIDRLREQRCWWRKGEELR